MDIELCQYFVVGGFSGGHTPDAGEVVAAGAAPMPTGKRSSSGRHQDLVSTQLGPELGHLSLQPEKVVGHFSRGLQLLRFTK